MPKPEWNMLPVLQTFFAKKEEKIPFVSRDAKLCGHYVPHRHGEMVAFGSRKQCVIEPDPDGTYPFCIACQARAAIQCAWCGGAIFPGDPVSIFIADQFEIGLAERATIYTSEPFQVLGCGRMSCVEQASDCNGVWSMSRVPHPRKGWASGSVRLFMDADHAPKERAARAMNPTELHDVRGRPLAAEPVIPYRIP